MKNYKGYWIDKVFFNNEKEIDDFLKDKAVNAYRQAVKLFTIHSTMENSIYCGERAEILVNKFGFTWEDVEALEIKTLKAIA